MQNRGFSLLELSIVLVIIGLIAGGIVAGSSMIRAAELRSVITERQQYQTAIHTFRDKYLGLPGDLKNATAFWGAEPVANCPGDESTPSTTTATCDGNGDNRVDWGDSFPAGTGGESHRFWQHLANAELISGSYTGTHSAGTCNGDGSCNNTIGVNAPASKLSGAGWSISHLATAITSLTANYFPVKNSGFFTFGAQANYTNRAAITPSEAWNIDTKTDDGKPGTGAVRSPSINHAMTPDCATTADPATAEYKLSLDSVECFMVFYNIY